MVPKNRQMCLVTFRLSFLLPFGVLFFLLNVGDAFRVFQEKMPSKRRIGELTLDSCSMRSVLIKANSQATQNQEPDLAWPDSVQTNFLHALALAALAAPNPSAALRRLRSVGCMSSVTKSASSKGLSR